MDLNTLLNVILALVEKYNTLSFSMTREELQRIRDELSALNVTLANLNADYYEDAAQAEFLRKIGVAKKAEELQKDRKAASSTRADKMAMIECEHLFINEIAADATNTRCRLIREQKNKVVNAIASRLHIPSTTNES